jgi:hypothetical protein
MNSEKDHRKHKAPHQKYFLKNNQDNDLINSEDDAIYFDENNNKNFNSQLSEPKIDKNRNYTSEKSEIKDRNSWTTIKK